MPVNLDLRVDYEEVPLTCTPVAQLSELNQPGKPLFQTNGPSEYGYGAGQRLRAFCVIW